MYFKEKVIRKYSLIFPQLSLNLEIITKNYCMILTVTMETPQSLSLGMTVWAMFLLSNIPVLILTVSGTSNTEFIPLIICSNLFRRPIKAQPSPWKKKHQILHDHDDIIFAANFHSLFNFFKNGGKIITFIRWDFEKFVSLFHTFNIQLLFYCNRTFCHLLMFMHNEKKYHVPYFTYYNSSIEFQLSLIINTEISNYHPAINII